ERDARTHDERAAGGRVDTEPGPEVDGPLELDVRVGVAEDHPAPAQPRHQPGPGARQVEQPDADASRLADLPADAAQPPEHCEQDIRVRIALLHPCFWPEVRRGTERVIRELADGLLARGHEPVLITSHPGETLRNLEDGLP